MLKEKLGICLYEENYYTEDIIPTQDNTKVPSIKETNKVSNKKSAKNLTKDADNKSIKVIDKVLVNEPNNRSIKVIDKVLMNQIINQLMNQIINQLK